MDALKFRFANEAEADEALFEFTKRLVGRVEIEPNHLRLTTVDGLKQTIAWQRMAAKATTAVAGSTIAVNEKLLSMIVRARSWLQMLTDGTYNSVEELAVDAKVHPKVVRQNITAGLLAPAVVEAVLNGKPLSLDLATLRASTPLSWRAQIGWLSE